MYVETGKFQQSPCPRILFCSCWSATRDCPHKMDAFLMPFFQELKEDLYIDGQELFYSAEIPGYSPANDIACIWVVPLLATADSKAHAEMGLTAAGGIKGCWRCNVTSRSLLLWGYAVSIQISSSPKKSCHKWTIWKETDSAPSTAHRKQLVKQNGVIGESLFYRLYNLCGFDPIYDLVIDDACDWIQPSEILELMLSQPTILRRDELDNALGYVPWTTELKSGRIPSTLSSYNSRNKCHLGNWKSETLVAPYVLHSIVPHDIYNCYSLLCQIHREVYCKCWRIEGWTNSVVQYLKELLWSHAIHYEHLYGTSASTENVEYSLHLPDDIMRHLSPDNYWWYMYERQVCFHKRQTTNQTQLCKTFSDRAAQLRFINSYFEMRECDSDEDNSSHIPKTSSYTN